MEDDDLFPHGKIKVVQDLGDCVRAQRKSQGATQADFAAMCGVGTRFISDLENGKPTIELGKTLQILACLGLEVSVSPRGWQQPNR